MSQRFDIYRDVHKGLRQALFNLTIQVGSTDCTDSAATEQLHQAMIRCNDLLELHAMHEDRHVQPVVDALDPALSNAITQRHQEMEPVFAALVEDARAIDSAAEDAPARQRRLYLDLSRFVADYLHHIADEEQKVQPLLEQHHDDSFLMELSARIRGEIPPPAMAMFLAEMIPAMNHGERLAMFSGMKHGAPAAVFKATCDLAQQVLDTADWQRLNAQLAG